MKLDRQKFFESLKSAPHGSSPGPGGCTCEHLRILLDDVVTTELLFEACTSLAQATLPSEISAALMSARLKPDGGVRGIATEETDFGQSRFGHPDLTNFGQIQFWPIQFWPIQFLAINFGQSIFLANPFFWPIFLVSCGGPKGGAPQGWGAKPRKSEGPKLWGPEGLGPNGGGSKGGGPKFRVFFSSPATIFNLFSLSCWSSRGIFVVFEAPVRSNVHVWSSLVVV